MNSIIEKKKIYKSIWLNTIDAVTTDGVREQFIFNNLPLIQVRGISAILKVNTITVGGDGEADAAGHNWNVKLDNIKYNRANYFNSDKNQIPTIACFNYDTKNSVNNSDFSLQLENQDINQLILYVKSDKRGNEESHGLYKNSKDIELHINLVIEEIHEF